MCLHQVVINTDRKRYRTTSCTACVPPYLVVWGVDYDEREEAIVEGLVEHLEEAAPVAGLHGIIELILFELLLNSAKIEHRAACIYIES